MPNGNSLCIIALSTKGVFQKNSLTDICYNLCKLEITKLAPTRFKNQTTDNSYANSPTSGICHPYQAGVTHIMKLSPDPCHNSCLLTHTFTIPHIYIHPCMEYCCQVWAGAPSCYLELLDKLQKWICRTVGPSLAASLETLAHRWNVASLSLSYRYYFGRCSGSTGSTSFFSREVYLLLW